MRSLNIPVIRDIKTIVGIKPHKYDGMGGYQKNSSRIPVKAWLGLAVFCLVMYAVLLIGAAAGF